MLVLSLAISMLSSVEPTHMLLQDVPAEAELLSLRGDAAVDGGAPSQLSMRAAARIHRRWVVDVAALTGRHPPSPRLTASASFLWISLPEFRLAPRLVSENAWRAPGSRYALSGELLDSGEEFVGNNVLRLAMEGGSPNIRWDLSARIAAIAYHSAGNDWRGATAPTEFGLSLCTSQHTVRIGGALWGGIIPDFRLPDLELGYSFEGDGWFAMLAGGFASRFGRDTSSRIVHVAAEFGLIGRVFGPNSR